ncbi:hypothetical protein Caci_3842 [Catenulispora acidiphila DSM 44928]|uniref:Uncharacterized protein n=1 Tax=Catenulispora acidiphila (strain DSM 44928 / JCM 14897 / NBRC 102108 / NRRL B-24433 / ID139908) TaxID=479433 RepID=C7QDE7_CATAD|nr:hypothetical protein [Catenulispora acidiphila]ACU72740.1 hypothetical protein Caci_3842 [Catenulispora acidiphila DSM 44928]
MPGDARPAPATSSAGSVERLEPKALSALVAFEVPSEDPTRRRAIAEAVVDLLMNAKERHARLRETSMRSTGGVIDHPELSFRLVRATGDDFAAEPTLRTTAEAIAGGSGHSDGAA